MNNVTYITYATGEKYLNSAESILSNGSKYFDETISSGVSDFEPTTSG